MSFFRPKEEKPVSERHSLFCVGGPLDGEFFTIMDDTQRIYIKAVDGSDHTYDVNVLAGVEYLNYVGRRPSGLSAWKHLVR